jgi:hypothetical protein
MIMDVTNPRTVLRFPPSVAMDRCVLSAQTSLRPYVRECGGHPSSTIRAHARPSVDALWALRDRRQLRANVPRSP